MQRRHFLIWFSRGVYTLCAAVVAGAAARFLGGPMSHTNPNAKTTRQRVTRLDSLVVGLPTLFPVIGTQQNAWSREPSQVIGNIWVTRLSDTSIAPEKTQISVFNAACPHNGCPVQKSSDQGFMCPCHGAEFKPDGKRAADTDEFTNPSPRGLDPLEHSLAKDDQGQWWLEVVFKNFETGLAERVPVA